MTVTKADRARIANFALNWLDGERYKITCNREVHVFHTVNGWALIGFVDDVLTDTEHHEPKFGGKVVAAKGEAV